MSQDGISRFLYATKACAYFPFQAWFRENGIAPPHNRCKAKRPYNLQFSIFREKTFTFFQKDACLHQMIILFLYNIKLKQKNTKHKKMSKKQENKLCHGLPTLSSRYEAMPHIKVHTRTHLSDTASTPVQQHI